MPGKPCLLQSQAGTVGVCGLYGPVMSLMSRDLIQMTCMCVRNRTHKMQGMQYALLLPYLSKAVFHCFRYTDCVYRPMLQPYKCITAFDHFLAHELATQFSTSLPPSGDKNIGAGLA
ncbi:predicted protein [Aspergillus nidulans FGSC A4]|uniref:Uncharacterized protein n=1 Tax=Emericella nidulans (strain FGSC A4 / ATCC 38163 / CBS 112.46 / NRRL 194 / M139) TaxID=227321 RepID=Q5B5Q0_EMENI|nr:hypothetical protein [Aspergillus nidulans FGSC A4]EAA59391.1 predicted protein [Aspergillus nidulans FGSC A4]CBF74639.1 TPA: conserved hypothetical protein [Aspergillus nidulans FGSC A4]|eukprot:XP_661734.1 predicted protein [Aspergillus nidulans FGSC A4]